MISYAYMNSIINFIKKAVDLLIPFAVITVVFFTIYAAVQQSIRQDANNPQIQMAEDAVPILAQGAKPEDVVAIFAADNGKPVDIAQSLAPFIAIYDDQGNALASSGYIGDGALVIPKGVFESIKANGSTSGSTSEDRLTLEPQKGVRIASVIERFVSPVPLGSEASTNGYVMAGRSLREAEDRVGRIGGIVLFGYVVSMIGWAIKRVIKCLVRPREA